MNILKVKLLLSYYRTAEVFTPQQSGNNGAILLLMILFRKHIIIGANNLTK